MTTLSLSRLTFAAGTLVLSLSASLSAGAGVAAAAPDLGPIVNTTCNYGQILAALDAQDPAAAADFNASSMASAWLGRFLESPPDKRERMAVQIQAMPEAQQYIGTIVEVANNCNNY